MFYLIIKPIPAYFRKKWKCSLFGWQPRNIYQIKSMQISFDWAILLLKITSHRHTPPFVKWLIRKGFYCGIFFLFFALEKWLKITEVPSRGDWLIRFGHLWSGQPLSPCLSEMALVYAWRSTIIGNSTPFPFKVSWLGQ